MQGLQRMSALDVPIYITETGIADAAGNRRPLWLETYIPEVERAVRDGLDVRGLMYWTLVDNFEVSSWAPRVALQQRSCTGPSWTTLRLARGHQELLCNRAHVLDPRGQLQG